MFAAGRDTETTAAAVSSPVRAVRQGRDKWQLAGKSCRSSRVPSAPRLISEEQRMEARFGARKRATGSGPGQASPQFPDGQDDCRGQRMQQHWERCRCLRGAALADSGDGRRASECCSAVYPVCGCQRLGLQVYCPLLFRPLSRRQRRTRAATVDWLGSRLISTPLEPVDAAVLRAEC